MRKIGWLEVLRTILLISTLLILNIQIIGTAENEFSNLQIKTDKEIYAPEDTIIITTEPKLITKDVRELLILTIRTDTKTYNYIGIPEFPIRFNLPEPDTYTILLLNKKTNNVISATTITTGTKETETEQQENQQTEKPTQIQTETAREEKQIISIINPKGIILENFEGIKRPVMIEQINTAKGPRLLIQRPIHAIESIKIKGLRDETPPRLGLEDIYKPINIFGRESIRSYAIDPTTMNFDEATITAIAQGTTLYECKEYDFETQTCWGDWQKKRNLEPGEIYTFTLTPEDPIYVELNDTLDCSCSYTQESNNAQISCEVIGCEYTIQVPSGATSFFVEEMRYNVDITMTSAGTIIAGTQNGYLDHDTTPGNGNEIQIGSSTYITSTTTTWINNNIDQTGTQSFNQDNCDNWPNYCTYYVHLDASLTFTTPGNSLRVSTVGISLNWAEAVLNYTEPGDFAVILENPQNNYYTRADPNQEFEYIPTSAETTIESCSLYTSEGGWSIKNTSTNINNGTSNFLSTTFSSEGTYNWNVECTDENNDTTIAVLNRVIHIDRTSPTINLISPVNYATITDENVVSFRYNVTDNSPINNCSLIINGTTMNTYYDVERNTENTINQVLNNGVYEWSVQCYDRARNSETSETRTITIDITPRIYTGQWFETSTTNCNTFPCNIGLAQETDGIENTVSGTISPGQTITIVNALSPFIGINGAEISSGTNVNFLTYYSAAENNLNVRWYLYKQSETGTNTLVCSNAVGTGVSGGATSTGSCTPSSDIRILNTDKLFYEIRMANSHNNQVRTFTHVVDHANSYVNAIGFRQIGFLSAELIEPEAPILIGQGDPFNLTCEIDCYMGYCLDLNVYAQSNQTGTWNNIGASGIAILGSGQSNPINYGNLYNNTINVTFNLDGSNPGTTNVRCRAQSKYSTAITDSEQIMVGVTTEPTITLNNPLNNSWINQEPVLLRYTPQTYGSLDYCTLYINEEINQTDNNPTENVQNTFSVSGLDETKYNWSVTCTDDGGLTGNSTTFNFNIDRQAPHNLTILQPDVPHADITQSWIDFEWIVEDYRSENLTCELYVNNILRETVNTKNDTITNTTLTGFGIGNYNWRMECADQAGNKNITDTYTITVTDIPPTISLVSPVNNGGTNENPATLSYIPYDGFGINSCTLYVNETLNQTSNTITMNEINTFQINIEETQYTWRVQCFDSNNNEGVSETWSFVGDFTLPTITLHTPINNSYFTQSSISFSYTGYDNWMPLICTINFNGVPNITTTTTNGATVTRMGTGYPDGHHYWDVTCTDIGGNTQTSESRNLTINQSPIIVQNAPLNNTQLRHEIINLTYTATDNDGFEYCDLYINGAYYQRNTTNVTSGLASTFEVAGLDEGKYNWSIACTDAGVFSNTNTSNNRTFIVDRTPPNITPLNPNNSQIVDRSTHNFTWITQDAYSELMMCNVYINNELNQTNIQSQNNTETGIVISGLLTGLYNWSLECADQAGNTNTSSTINFEVLLPPKITLVSPLNNTGSTSRDTTFTFIPSEGSGAFTTCSLILNGNIAETSNTITANTQNSITHTNMPDGAYEWNIQCTDTNSLTGTAEENWTYYVDNEPPYEIELLNPLNNTIETRNNVSFTFIARDAVSPEMYCDIFLTEYEPIEDTYSLASYLLVQNNTPYTFSELLRDGLYSWNVLCVDKADLFLESHSHFFEVIAPPNVTLISPANYTWFNTNNVTLTYFPEDDFQIIGCELIINGETNQTNNIIFNKQNNTFDLNNVPEGEYNWTVACTDNDANTHTPDARSFYIDLTSPSITLNNPLINELLNTSTVIFNWTVTDTLSPLLMCDLYVNEEINRTNILVNNDEPHLETVTGFDDGLFNWSVFCRDLATNNATSLTRNFEVQEPPTVILGNPVNNYRNNTVNMNLYYTASDNSRQINQCTLIINGEVNQTTSSAVHGTQTYFELTNLENGTYTWDVLCTDNNDNEGRNWTGKVFHVDLAPPIITLISPEIDETFNQNDITFYWNATDFNSSIPLVCELYVTNPPGDIIITNLTGMSGDTFNYTLYGLEDGEHFWNVTCMDDLGNTDTSDTWRFAINQPDLYLDETRINFNNTNPDLYEPINITANVSNLGGVMAMNALVEFWQITPGQDDVLIGSQRRNVTSEGYEIYWVEWIIPEGHHTIYVVADPYDEIAELDETNNNASKNISVLRAIINEPINGSIFNYNDVTLNFTLQDYTSGLINYTILVDNTPTGQTGQVQDNTSEEIILNLNEGIRQITLRATDEKGRIKDVTITITIDLTAPVPIILTENNTWFNTTNPEINIRITDNFANNISYTLYVNGTETITGHIINNEAETIQLTDMVEGTYELILEGEDEAGNKANSTTTIIYIDITPPTITLNAPDNGANFTTRDVLLNYTVQDNMAQTGICYVNVSGTINGPYNANIGESQSFLAENLTEGEHYWNVMCTDEAGNTNTSETIIFNVFIPPEITLISPINNYWSNTSTNTFTYFVSDDTGINQCFLYLNDELNQTSTANNNENNTFIVNGMNGLYTWRVECTDTTIFNTRGISENRTLYVDLEAPSPVIETLNNTWFNSNPQITFTITDNMASTINYTIYVNGTANLTGIANNNTQTTRTIIGLENGIYEIFIEGEDYAGNKNISETIIIFHDTIAPTITLNYPINDTNSTSTSINLSFTPSDNMAQYLMCAVTLNNNLIAENLNVTNNNEEIVELTGLMGGYYYWNVTCTDQATNTNTSEMWMFFIPIPDLSVNASEIYFSEENPRENDEITITTTIRNIGGSPAGEFIVQFWANEVNTTGNQIGENITIPTLDKDAEINASVNFTVPIGTTEIIVYVNPDNRVTEDNYTNNIASRNISVEFWHYALGTTNDTLKVTDASAGLLFDWNVENSTGSNIYVTDYDSQISWTTLQALGRDINNQERLNDFNILDSALGSYTYGDSINRTYTQNNALIETESFDIFGTTISNVPVINSTNNENFKTGILWDYQGVEEYNGTQNILFITRINKGAQGYNTTNDFEIRIPATLREYQGPDLERVVFYTELK
jgi:hypothetical protein